MTGESSPTPPLPVPFVRLLLQWRPSLFTISVILAVAIGLISGLAAVIFRRLIDFFHAFFFGHLQGAFTWMGNLSIVPVPAMGGLIVGLLVYSFARETKGHGVPEVMLAVAKDGGRIRGRVSVVKALASSICIGSGGSVGREGPIVQIGASLASYLGQRFGVSEGWLRVLVACGAAGGISATFNAPIAGVFFALEVILGTFEVQHFGVVVLSSVIADIVSRSLMGNVPAFDLPAFALYTYWELGFYALLGVLAAVLGVAFIFCLYWMEDLFETVQRVPAYVKPAIGGLLLGLIGCVVPQIFGVGYEAISQAMLGEYGFFLLAGLTLLKIAATSLTLGSGGSGGVFAPSLFIGSMGGAAFGTAVHAIMPGLAGPAGGYGLVGMAAVFGATAWAPMTAILMIFEMTRNYSLILPLMLATVIGTAVSHLLTTENIYTLKLARRGINLYQARQPAVADDLPVSQVMTRNYPTVPWNLLVTDLQTEFERTGVNGFPVLDNEGNLSGIVTASDAARAVVGKPEARTVEDIASHTLIVTHPEQRLGELLYKLGAGEVGYIPVVARNDPKRLLGMLRRHDIIRAYADVKRRKSGGEFIAPSDHSYNP